MRQVLVTLLAVTFVSFAALAQAGNISPALQDQLAQASPDQPLSVIVHLTEQAPITGISADLTARKATRQQRHEEIVRALQDAARSQEPLAAELEASKRDGGVLGYTRYWIANLMVVQAVPAEIERLAGRSDVAYIEPNFTVDLIDPVMERPAYQGDETELDTRGIGVAPGLEAIRATEVWRDLGIDGSGALIGSLDTGVQGSHPALASRWRGTVAPVSECWLDVIGSGADFPSDGNSHGTHTTGTMCGLAPDDTIGVAPGAMWIAANAIDQGANPGFDNDIIECFQWFADPDGDPATSEDVPDVVQNSWGVHEGFTGYNDCDDRWWAVIDHCEAAGVCVTWSAGNEDFDGLRSPADRASTFYNCFSVGSTQYYFPYEISSFSSRGPSTCPDIINPALAIKPEVSAPGSDIYSALPGSSYGYKSGTSMAGPHVAGVVALMRAANPDLEVDLIKQILMDTATDLGPAGEDNTYGWGIIDAYDAVLAAMDGFGTLEGTVTNASYGDVPLGGARVDLPERGWGWNADVNGYYSGMASAGTYTAVCSLEGFATATTTVEVVDEGVTVQDFALTDIAGPAISEVSQPVSTTDTAGPYVITARAFDFSTVAAVELYWRIGAGAWNAAPMALDGDLYTAAIPGHPANTAIAYYVAATDGVGLQSTAPVDAPADFYELVITEAVYSYQAEDPGDPAWQLGAAGDQADAGLWVREDPVGVIYEGTIVMQPEDDVTVDPGVACFVTGNGVPGGEPGAEDVDHGCTTLLSPVFDLTGVDRAFVSFWRWFAQDGFTVDDDWVIEATNDGSSWVELERISGSVNAWEQVAVELGALDNGQFALTSTVQLRFLACDNGGGGLVEAAIDDFELQVYTQGTVGVEDGQPADVPVAALSLEQNFPNPFNPQTTIGFSLPRTENVRLSVFDMRGRLVRTLVDEARAAGSHTVIWNGTDNAGQRVASGSYVYRLTTDSQEFNRVMLLVK